MARKRDEGKAEPGEKILLREQVAGIDWATPDRYDFFDTPREVRNLLVTSFLEWALETYQREMWDKHKKRITQNHYAMKTIGIDAQSFSIYKSGSRFPSMPSADILAAYYGNIIYDITGYNRRMPRERELYKINDVWGKLDDRMKAELMERINNHLDNKNSNANLLQSES